MITDSQIIETCYQCGKCTASCPLRKVSLFSPRIIAEDYILDRTSTKGSPGLSGFVRVIIGDQEKMVTIYNTMPNRYTALVSIKDDQYSGKATNAKAAFFDLLNNLKKEGIK